MPESHLPTRHFSNPDQTAPLALGCWALGGKQWGGQHETDSREVLQSALDAGLTHWDTAQAYGSGLSESLCGEWLSRRRSEIFIATKGQCLMSEERFLRKLDDSRKRLNVEKIDLYYIHWPKSEADLAKEMEYLEKARAAGKIGFIGVSNFSIDQMETCSKAGRIDVHQFNYSLYWRKPEAELIPYCNERGIATVTYSSIAQGILTGKFPRNPKFGEKDQRPMTYFFQEDVWPHLYETTEELKSIAAESEFSLLELAVQWVQRRAGIQSVIVGARNRHQLETNLTASKRFVPDSLLDRMTAISDSVLAKLPPDPGNLFNFHP